MKEIYSLRKSFSIIGITGRMGSGCTKFSELLSSSKEAFFNQDKKPYLREPSSLIANNKPSDIFKRKYSICYNFCQNNWLKYKVIDYKMVLIFFLIDYYKESANPLEAFTDAICKLFCKSSESDADFPEFTLQRQTILDQLRKLDFPVIISQLKQITVKITEIKDKQDLNLIYDIFFSGNSLSEIYRFILVHLESNNYYLRTFLFHKLANNLRSTGNPVDDNDGDGTHIYTIAKTINKLIKAYKNHNIDNCHIAINSLKNSLEIMFFKERYSAFYIAAIHNEDRYKARIQNRLGEAEHKAKTYQKLVELDSIEYKSDNFSDGDFAAPDIENCIQKSEIHISNNDNTNKEDDFITLNEQIIKYQALIQQPGIITPSSIERCMQIAYNAKFNSGCISRQVGAVITDQGYTVKSIGWNDVPAGSIPCLLRNAEELISKKNSTEHETYSEFELTTEEEFRYQANSNNKNKEFIGKTFIENLEVITSDDIAKVKAEGKNCSFCFKAYHNKFEGEKNQVHTRSLHAEENAMLQIAKHGGQPLLNGILFTTASPCELCSKKAFQLGVTTVVYIDKYPGISTSHVLKNGYGAPILMAFKGAIGKSYNKLYEPFISYKDELKLITKKPRLVV
jgi:deoxycytidylate deaminase